MLSIFVPGRYLISTCLDPPLTYENTPSAASSASRSDPISVMTDPAPPSPREPESASAKTFARCIERQLHVLPIPACPQARRRSRSTSRGIGR